MYGFILGLVAHGHQQVRDGGAGQSIEVFSGQYLVADFSILVTYSQFILVFSIYTVISYSSNKTAVLLKINTF